MRQSDHNRVAFLFPGQGSQYVGMGKELASLHPIARQTFQEADEALAMKLSTICFEGPEDQLKLTEITQPAILTTSVAAWRVVREKGLNATFAVGHSLGEYSAHVAAGTLQFSDAVRTVRLRGRYMQAAVPVGTGAMAAILGMPLDRLRAICHEVSNGQVCEAANINSPEQVAISGHAEAVARATELARHHGARRAILLQVSAPFHSSLLAPAQRQMEAELSRIQFHPMEIPVVTNVDAAAVETPEEARDALTRQVTGAVQWERSMRVLIARGVDTFVELGPGKVLCGLMRQIDRSKTCFNVDDEASLQKLVHHFSHVSAGAF